MTDGQSIRNPFWPVGRLGDALLDIEAGVSPKALDRPARGGELAVLKVSAVTWQEFRATENKALPDLFDGNGCPRVRQGDLLMSRANTAELLASPVLVNEDHPNLLLSDKTLRLVPNHSVIETRYLLYALRTWPVRRFFASHATGTSGSMRNVSQATILACPIPLPPLPEQRRIAEVLDRAAALRAKRRAALAQLDTLTQAVFLDMFGDPASNPKDWQWVRIGEVADVQGGLQVSASRKACPREAPYLRVANVLRGKLDLNEIKTIRATEAEITRTTLEKNDLLIVEGHGNPSEIGRSALWDGSLAGCVHQNHIIRARFQNGIIPRFACEFLNSPSGRQHLLRAGKTTSGLNTICVSDVRATPLACPPVELQQGFATRVESVGKLRSIQRSSLAQLDALFASLQHRAFRGEL